MPTSFDSKRGSTKDVPTVVVVNWYQYFIVPSVIGSLRFNNQKGGSMACDVCGNKRIKAMFCDGCMEFLESLRKTPHDPYADLAAVYREELLEVKVIQPTPQRNVNKDYYGR